MNGYVKGHRSLVLDYSGRFMGSTFPMAGSHVVSVTRLSHHTHTHAAVTEEEWPADARSGSQ